MPPRTQPPRCGPRPVLKLSPPGIRGFQRAYRARSETHINHGGEPRATINPGRHRAHSHRRAGHGGAPVLFAGRPTNGFDPNDASSFDPADPTSNDGDGFTELAEGVPFYGPILLSFADEGELGILADADGKIDFAQSYDLSENVDGDMRAAIVNGAFGIDDREIVIHGIETTAGRIDQIGEGLGGGVDPSITVDPYYNVAIPAAVGEVAPAPVPLPAGALLLLGGLGTLGAMRARARRKA
jgi:hypothetical protein